MARFYTSLITTDYWQFDAFPYKGKNWGVKLLPWRFSQSRVSACYGRRWVNGKEVVIESPSEKTALTAFQTILYAIELWSGSFGLVGAAVVGDNFPLANESERREQLSLGKPSNCHSTDDIPWACRIAAKASHKLSHMIALSKWRLSCENCSVPVIERDPAFRNNIQKPNSIDESVRLAHAIIAGYGVVEELGLQINASSQNPSRIGDEWNPSVKADLERRLTEAGVDLNDRFSWDVRGAVTKLETQRPAQIYKSSTKQSWSRYTVRDIDVSIVDAVAHASWLRSSVSAHKLKSKIPLLRGLSIYEVTNVQSLARRLLLTALGLWNKHPSLCPKSSRPPSRR